jgi:hypothetical protein
MVRMTMPDATERTLLTPWLHCELEEALEADWDDARTRRTEYLAKRNPTPPVPPAPGPVEP